MFDILGRHDIETLLIDRVLNKKHFYGKNHTENVHQKLVLDPLLILVNNPKQSLHARNSTNVLFEWPPNEEIYTKNGAIAREQAVKVIPNKSIPRTKGKEK